MFDLYYVIASHVLMYKFSTTFQEHLDNSTEFLIFPNYHFGSLE